MNELLASIHSAGYVVNNLFETVDGWQCNLRSATSATVWGKGSTYLEALSEALDKAYACDVVPLYAPETTAFAETKISLSSIVASAAPKIKRRF